MGVLLGCVSRCETHFFIIMEEKMKRTLFFALAFVVIMSLSLSLGACEFGNTHTHDFTMQNTDEAFLKSDADCTNSAV